MVVFQAKIINTLNNTSIKSRKYFFVYIFLGAVLLYLIDKKRIIR